VTGLSRTPGHAFDQVQVADPACGERLHRMPEERLRVAVGDVVERRERGETHAHTVVLPDLQDSIGDLEQQARAVLDASPVVIGTAIRLIPQKLIEQIAVGGVYLDPVETGLAGQLRGVPIVRDDARDLLDTERAGRHHVDHPSSGVDLPGRLYRRGRNRQGTAFLQVGVRNAADMPELDEDLAVLRMHGIGDLLPAGDLCVAVNPRGLDITLALRRDLRRLADDQAGARPLSIISCHQWRRHIAGTRTAACQWRHDDAVGEPETAEPIGQE
jgi:hypothetical protein